MPSDLATRIRAALGAAEYRPGYHRGTMLGYAWSCGMVRGGIGPLVRIRYMLGSAWEAMWGYVPDSRALPHRLARLAGLSGY